MTFNEDSIKHSRRNVQGVATVDGGLIWCDDKGELHREDGPAMITNNKFEIYYNHGNIMTKKQWIQWLKSGNPSISIDKITRLILENS
jgi:hypothetical protein